MNISSKKCEISLISLIIIVIGFFAHPAYGQTIVEKDYLKYVKQFADKLLVTAPDTCGAVNTRLWASVIDTRDGSIPGPDESVPPTPGTRAIDRAIWGSNYYHDLSTVKTFRALSAITGNAIYREATEEYSRNFLIYTQNPTTGLLGWGEHLYYNFYSDTVMVGDGNTGHAMSKEFLAETPPWKLLWSIDSTRIQKALEAQIYHFRTQYTQTFMFNRHANWNKIKHKEYRGLQQFQQAGQAWIKHSALLAYSFMYLYKKTNNKEWLKWAEGVGSLYWRYRNPDTNLTPSDLDDPRPGARHASLSSMSLLSYWLLKAWQLNPDQTVFKERAVKMLKAIEEYSWDAKSKQYRGGFKLDGTMVNEDSYKAFTSGYSSFSILQFGRIAAYFAKVLDDPQFKMMAYRAAGTLEKASLPNNFVINNLAEALNFSLDMFELTNEASFLEDAQRFANIGIEKMSSNGLFVRQLGDPYYEAKIGVGEYVQGLLRLHLQLNDANMLADEVDWSF